MRSKSLLALSSVVSSLLLVVESFQQNDDDEKPKRHITECDKEIGKILCDDFQQDMADCAALMPPEEPPFFYKCGKTVLELEPDNMGELLQVVCSKPKQVETAWDVVDCWNDEMEQAVKNMTNDKVYPEEHFRCKKKIFKAAIKKASCQCQLEKGFMCDVPANKFG